MAMAALICPTCGAPLEIAGTKEFGYCAYCGTKVVKDRQYIELSGQVAVQDMAGEASLLERAFLFLEDGNFSRADQYLERVLDINPRCSKAYIGKLLVSLSLKSMEELGRSLKPLTLYDSFNKAMRFANAEEAESYERLNRMVLALREQEKVKKEGELSSLQANIASGEQYLFQHRNQYNKAVAKKWMWILLLILSIFSIFIWTIGAIFVVPFVIVDILCIVWMVFMIRKTRTEKRSIDAYKDREMLLRLNRDLFSRKQLELENWLSER